MNRSTKYIALVLFAGVVSVRADETRIEQAKSAVSNAWTSFLTKSTQFKDGAREFTNSALANVHDAFKSLQKNSVSVQTVAQESVPSSPISEAVSPVELSAVNTDAKASAPTSVPSDKASRVAAIKNWAVATGASIKSGVATTYSKISEKVSNSANGVANAGKEVYASTCTFCANTKSSVLKNADAVKTYIKVNPYKSVAIVGVSAALTGAIAYGSYVAYKKHTEKKAAKAA